MRFGKKQQLKLEEMAAHAADTARAGGRAGQAGARRVMAWDSSGDPGKAHAARPGRATVSHVESKQGRLGVGDQQWDMI